MNYVYAAAELLRRKPEMSAEAYCEALEHFVQQTVATPPHKGSSGSADEPLPAAICCPVSDCIPVPVFQTDSNGKYLSCNKAWFALSAYLPEQVIGRKAAEISADSLSIVFLAETIKDSKQFPQHTERECLTQDKKRITLLADCINYTDEAGNRIYITTLTDITEMRQTEKKLRQTSDILRLAQQTAGLGCFILDYECRKENWTDELFHILGYGGVIFEPAYGELFRHIHPNERDLVDTTLRYAWEANRDFSLEIRFTRNDNTHGYALCRGAIHQSVAGRRGKLVGSLLDITRQKETERLLAESEEKFRTFVAQMKDGAVVSDSKGQISLWNNPMEELSGIPEKTARDLGVWGIYEHVTGINKNLDVNKLSRFILRQALSDSEHPVMGQMIELTLKTETATKHIQARMFPVFAGGRYYTGAILRDVTPMREAEAEARRRDYLLEVLFESTQVGILIVDQNADSYTLNEAFTHITGFTSDSLTIDNLEKTLMPEAETLEHLVGLSYNSTAEWERQIIRSDGKSVWIGVNAGAWKNEYSGQTLLTFVINDITSRKNDEIQLLQASEIFNNIPLGLLIYRFENNGTAPSFKYVRSNPAALEMIGGNESDSSLKIAEITPYIADLYEAYAQTIKTGQIYQNDRYYNPQSGKAKDYYSIRAFPLNDNQLCVAFDNITPRVQAEAALRRSERALRMHKEKLEILVRKRTADLKASEFRLTQAFRITNEGFWDWEVQSGETIFSPAYYSMIGYEPGEFPTRFSSWEERVHPDDIASTLDCVKTSLIVKRKPFEVEFRLRTKTGEYKWIRGRGTVIEYGPDGIPLRVIGTHTDIDQEKKATLALQASKERYRNLVEQLTDWIWETDTKLVYTYSSPHVENLLGYTPSEVLGKTPFDFMPESQREKLRQESMKILAKLGHFDKLINEAVHKDGHIVVLETSGKPAFDKTGHFVGYIGVDRNVTERIKAQQLIRESELKFRNVFNGSADIIAITDTKGSILEINDVGKPLLEDGKKNLQSLLTASDTELAAYFEDIKASRTALITTSMNCIQKHTVCFFELSGRLIHLNEDAAFLHVFRDISLRKEFEQRLLQATLDTEQKERSRLAKDLHDDLGPQLSAIKLYIDSLDSDHYPPEKKRLMIQNSKEIIVRAIGSTREIANNLMPNTLEQFGFVEATKLFCDKIRSSGAIKIQLKISPRHLRLENKHEISLFRIVTELINNTLRHAKASEIKINIGLDNQRFLLEYSDNGNGFDLEAHLKQHPDGIGMANIYSRVRSMNADFKIETAQGKGFTATLQLVI